jgi:hypothetical protein
MAPPVGQVDNLSINRVTPLNRIRQQVLLICTYLFLIWIKPFLISLYIKIKKLKIIIKNKGLYGLGR